MDSKQFTLHIYAREKKINNKTMYFYSYKNPQTGLKYDVKFTKSAALLASMINESGFYKIEGAIENFSLAEYKESSYGSEGCIWIRSYGVSCRDLVISRDFDYEEELAKQRQEIFKSRIM